MLVAKSAAKIIGKFYPFRNYLSPKAFFIPIKQIDFLSDGI